MKDKLRVLVHRTKRVRFKLWIDVTRHDEWTIAESIPEFEAVT